MARKRMIDPSFWTDEKIGKLKIENRLLFMGLISNADDEGRLVGHPAIIKSTVFPYDEISIKKTEEMLNNLAELKIIIIYENDNQTYIQIINFNKYQTINKPTVSRYPQYNDSNSVVVVR